MLHCVTETPDARMLHHRSQIQLTNSDKAPLLSGLHVLANLWSHFILSAIFSLPREIQEQHLEVDIEVVNLGLQCSDKECIGHWNETSRKANDGVFTGQVTLAASAAEPPTNTKLWFYSSVAT
jgi:hypothetical protein